MNKLLLTTALLSACFVSCYKEKDPADVHGILISHRWYMTAKTVALSPVVTDCALNEQLVFKKDSTGYFYNPTPCDTSLHHADSVSFTWYISADRKNIFFRNLGGVSGKNNVMGIGNINDDNLRIFGAFNTVASEFVYDKVDQ